jgi:hypothetical protein
MKLDFLQKISFKFILIHCLAGFLLIFAASLLGYINNIEVASSVEKNGVNEAMKQLGAERLSDYTIWFYISPILGLLTSTLITYVLFMKRELFWLNSIVVFLCLLLFNYLGLFRLEYTKYVAYQMNFGLVVNVIVSSACLIIFASILYYYSFKISKNEN